MFTKKRIIRFSILELIKENVAVTPFAIMIGAFVIALLFNGNRALWDTSETRYAEAAREMAVTGEWGIPHLEGHVHLTKPPVAYWFYAVAIKVIGKDEFAVRLPLAFSFALTVYAVYLLAELFGGVTGGLWAALIYAFSPLPLIGSHVVTTDGILCTASVWFMTMIFYSLRAEAESARKRYSIVAGCLTGLAFLIKGPPALLPLLIFPVIKILYPRMFTMRSAFGWRYLLPAFIIGLSWYGYVLAVLPDAMKVWKDETLRKVFVESRRDMPWWNYLWILAVGCLPTVPVFIGYFVNRKKSQEFVRRVEIDSKSYMPLLLWVGIPFVVFCFSKTRLPLYLLPLGAPVCVVGGILIAQFGERMKTMLIVSMAISFVFVIGFIWWKYNAESMASDSKDMRPVADAIRTDSRIVNKPVEILMNESFMGNGLAYYLDGPNFQRVKMRKGHLTKLEGGDRITDSAGNSAVYLVSKVDKTDKEDLSLFGMKVFENESWEVFRKGN